MKDGGNGAERFRKQSPSVFDAAKETHGGPYQSPDPHNQAEAYISQLQYASTSSQQSRNGKISVKLIPKNFTKSDSQMTSLNLEFLNKKPQSVIKKNPARSPYSSKCSSRLVSHLALRHALSEVESGHRARMAGHTSNSIAGAPAPSEAARTQVGKRVQFDAGKTYDVNQAQSRYILRHMNGPIPRRKPHAALTGQGEAANAYGDSEVVKIEDQRESRSTDQHSRDSTKASAINSRVQDRL